MGSYSKRVMARDLVEVMAKLGPTSASAWPGTTAAGASRTAWHSIIPSGSRSLAVLDIEPTLDTWEGLWLARGRMYAYHWYFLAQARLPSPRR